MEPQLPSGLRVKPQHSSSGDKMIIFHEGLPGSGKSFEAMVAHIVPALKKRRKVFAYMEGLDHAKIAACAEISEEECRALLFPITREQVPEIHALVENDSLVVIDELQNFWPAGRSRLGPEITQFVTEHRHRGLDILAMGQVLNDCHALWKGRVDTKIVFRKLDAIGKAHEYKWATFKRVDGGKFQEVTSGKKPYDAKFFGTYASHTDDTTNTDTYVDERANVKNSKAWRMIKIYGSIAVFAIGFVVWFFATGGGLGQKKPEKKPEVVAAVAPQVVQVQPSAMQPLPRVTVSEVMGQLEMEANDYIDKLTEKHRMRLSGVSRSSRSIVASIEWRDDSNRVIEILTADQLRGLGWFVMLSADGGIASVSKPGKSYIATQWPIADDRSNAPEKVPDSTQKKIAGPEKVAMAPVE